MSTIVRLVLRLLSAALCAVLLLGCGGGAPEDRPTAVSVAGLGALQGAQLGSPGANDDLVFFGGIPYAKPPTGSLRWQPPQPHGPWEGTPESPRDATSYRSTCVQDPAPEPGISEDCLFLNIATPMLALQGTAKIPVMFHIHGGGYQVGRSNWNVHDDKALVVASNLSVVVVSINYRLNVFGFLGSSEIQRNTSDNTTGNFGIQDQRLALLWVKEHIANFGGDSDDITIFGNSAGGNSVIHHLVQPASSPLFQKAVIQSGAYDLAGVPLATAEEGYRGLLNATGCSELSCLRGLDSGTIFTNGRSSAPGPVVDGVWLTAMPIDLIAQGRHNKVPVAMGATRDEDLTPWFFSAPKNLTEPDFDALAAQLVGSNRVAEVKALYEPSVYSYPADLGEYSQWAWTWGRMLTDRVPGLGHCAIRWLAKSLEAAGTPALYVYSFDHPPQKENGMPGSFPGSVIAAHSCEIPYVFGDSSLFMPGEEMRLGADTSAYFVNFAKRGDPNMDGLPVWPRYTAQSDIALRLDVASGGGIRTQQNIRKIVCDWWEDDYNPAEVQVVV